MLKTPVQILNERCAKGGILPPNYEFEQKQVLPSTIFQCTCSLKMNAIVYVAIGDGQKKKDAMQNAAKAMFFEQLKISYEDQGAFDHHLRPVLNSDIQRWNEAAVSIKDVNARDVLVEDLEFPEAALGNPIADLDEYCRKHLLSGPEYDMFQESQGPSHCPVLTVSCKVGTLIIKGSSKTKKVAKRIVACKVLKHLKNLLAASGTFGNLTMPVPSPPPDEECLQQLSVKGNVSTTCQRLKEKTHDYFLGANVFKRNTEFAEKLGNHDGKYFQQVLAFARGVDENHFMIANPDKLYCEWLTAQEEGIMGFYEELKKELKFEDAWNTMDKGPTLSPGDNDRYMVTLELKIPDIDFEPAAIKMGNELSKLNEEAAVSIICYMGTVTVRNRGVKNKGTVD